MRSIEALLVSGPAAVVASTLLHFLWQGSLLALLLAVSLQLARNAASPVRYALACGTLVLMAGCPLATIVWLQGQGAAAGSLAMPPAPSLIRGEEQSRPPGPLAELQPESAIEPAEGISSASIAFRRFHLHWLPLFWLAGVTLFLVRFAAGLLLVGRLRRQSCRPAAERWQIAVRKLSARLGITWEVALVDSSQVDSPGVIGWRRPVVLLPPRAIDGLTPAQVEGLLAHELAHVRRHDYFVNLWQTVLEAFGFFHPAVWWVSARIRDEREHCCDDLAIAACGDRTAYALALAVMQEIRSRPTPLIAAATNSHRSGRSRRYSDQ